MNTVEILRSHDIKPTIVRMKVYEYLYSMKNHPTADTIYKSLSPEIPTLSKTSVYNTTTLFLTKNLIRPVTIEENEIRYDADTTDHGHFKCTACSEVYDFNADLSKMEHNLSEDFQINERQLLFKGICSYCKRS
ncbi:MAG: transcriptional repressor [Spirochaetales bacterium]|nr:transcriptional repressor [Spirochaetales bacterium]